VLDALTLQDPMQDITLFAFARRWDDHRNVLTDSLFRRVPVKTFGSGVPVGDKRVRILGVDGVVGRLDDGGQAFLRGHELRPLVSGH
jgi:hypothetical protein